MLGNAQIESRHPPIRVGEGLDKPIVRLAHKLAEGVASDGDLEFAEFVINFIRDSVDRYALRCVVERGWPSPSAKKCGLSPAMYRKAVTTLSDAGLLESIGVAGVPPRWLKTKQDAVQWLSSTPVPQGV